MTYTKKIQHYCTTQNVTVETTRHNIHGLINIHENTIYYGNNNKLMIFDYNFSLT